MNVETHVSVPASSANLGAGFDVFGLAIGLRDEYLFRSADRDIIEATGKFSSHVPRDTKRNLAFRAFKSLAPTGTGSYRLKAQREIPPAGGLGGSAAAIVGGLVAANRAFELGYDNDELLRRATEIEGHPDNVAAALLGGLVLTVQTNTALHSLRVPFPSDIGIVLLVPSYRVPTAKARAILPSSVKHTDAVANIARAAMMIAALQTMRYDLLAIATEDFLHQPYREILNPILRPSIAAARTHGAYGAALSGSGPTIVAFTPPDRTMRIAGAMVDVAVDANVRCETYVVSTSNEGAVYRDSAS